MLRRAKLGSTRARRFRRRAALWQKGRDECGHGLLSVYAAAETLGPRAKRDGRPDAGRQSKSTLHLQLSTLTWADIQAPSAGLVGWRGDHEPSPLCSCSTVPTRAAMIRGLQGRNPFHQRQGFESIADAGRGLRKQKRPMAQNGRSIAGGGRCCHDGSDRPDPGQASYSTPRTKNGEDQALLQ